MAAKGQHRYCGGKGYVRLASGADGHCFGCNGTGQTIVVTAEAKAARANLDKTYAVLAAPNVGIVPVASVGRGTFRREVLRGLESLAANEPHRLPALYVSMDSGRVQAVAEALYHYATKG